MFLTPDRLPVIKVVPSYLKINPSPLHIFRTSCCSQDALCLLYRDIYNISLKYNINRPSLVIPYYQRWSRGHKARGQGQGHKKNPRPRPRTALPRTEPLEAKDRNARGQGQGPRTQPQVFSKKKGLQKSFPDNLQFKGVARIFDWGGLNHKSHAMTSSKICLLFT